MNSNDSNNQHLFQCEGVPLSFPYPPYDSQINMMSKILKCLKNSENGLFESPTGTGKTLMFLVSILGFLKEHNNNKTEKTKSKLFYFTRTHSQIDGIIKELRKTIFQPKICILASRNILCLNEELSELKSNMKNLKCKKIKKTCFFYNEELDSKDLGSRLNLPIMDIEDLSNYGKTNKICPFYLTLKTLEKADLVILSYNYILDYGLRNILRPYNDCIYLFDESHNVDDLCEEKNSSQIYKTQMIEVIIVLQEIFDNFDINEILQEDNAPKAVETFLTDLKGFTSNFVFPITGLKLFGHSILQFFSQYFEKSISHLKFNLEDELCERIKLEKDGLNDIFTNKKNQRKVKILHKFINFLWSMRNCLKKPEFLKHFTLYLKAGIKKDKNNQDKDSSLIKLLCFDPSLSFSSLKKENFRSIMFTSGTLSPISYYEIRLGLKFGVIFNNDNVFDSKKNLKVAVINKSLDKRQNFNFTYRNRENIVLFKELGNAIISLISVIPNGVLVFFPSYGLMQKCADIWRKLNFIEEIRKIKPIFVDNSKNKNKKNEKNLEEFTLKKYLDAARTENGAILFTVLRGKLSEGVDFKDKDARAVFIVGVPFASIKDISISLKIEYLDRRYQDPLDKYPLSGERWYTLNALKAVNQAIGRIIRHKDDYGVIGLFDERFFIKEAIKENLSSWAKDTLQYFETWKECLKEYNKFFEEKNKAEKKTENERNFDSFIMENNLEWEDFQ